MSEAQQTADKRMYRSSRDSKGRSVRNPNKNITTRRSRVDKLSAERASYPNLERLPRIPDGRPEADGRSRISIPVQPLSGERESPTLRGRPASKSNASDRKLSPLAKESASASRWSIDTGKPPDLDGPSRERPSTDRDRWQHKGANRGDDIMMAPNFELDEKMDQNDEKYIVPRIKLDPELVDKNLRCKKRRRRNSVSAESLDDEPNTYQEYRRRVFPKSDGALRSIQESCSTCFLFQGMDGKRKKDMYDAMYSRQVKAGEVIYKQGEASGAFFVIETGKYQARHRVSKREKEQVFEYNDRGVFGEYALMYNTGQNATVVCIESGILWVLDKEIFMRGLFLGQRRRHARYEDFVGKLTFLNELPVEAKERIPDCLQTRIYQKDEWIIQQGDREPRGFYIIEEGSVVVTQFVRGVEREIRRLKALDFFGEIALVEHTRRTANVKVLSDRCIVVRMDNAWFYQLLGPLIKTTFLDRIKSYRQAKVSDKVAPGIQANLALWDLMSSEPEESDGDGGI